MPQRAKATADRLSHATLTVLISRPASQLTEFLRVASDRKVRIIPFPLMSIEPTIDRFDTAEIAQDLADTSWLLFTSANAVRVYLDFLRKHNIPIPSDISVGVIGKKTAEMVERYSLQVNLCPKEEIAEGLLQEFLDLHLPHDKIITIPAAADVRPVLVDGLLRAGYHTNRLDIYRNAATPAHLLPVISDEQIDYFCFLSSSAVERYNELFGRPTGTAVSIGKITTATMNSLGWLNIIELPEPDLNRLWEVIDA